MTVQRRVRDVLASSISTAYASISRLTAVCSRLTASDLVVVGSTLVVVALVGASLVGVFFAAFVIVAGMFAAATTRLLANPRPAVRLLGSALAVPAAMGIAIAGSSAAVFAVGSGVGVFGSLSVWALIVATLAAGFISWERLGSGGVRRGSIGTALAAIGVFVVVLALVVPNTTVRNRAGDATGDVFAAFWASVIAANGSWAVLSFTGLVFLVAVTLGRTAAYLPLSKLFPPDRRDGLSEVIDLFRRGCSIAIRLAVAGTIGALAASSVSDRVVETPATPAEIALALPAPLGESIATVVQWSPLRAGLVSLFSLAVCAAALEWFRRTFADKTSVVFARVLAPAVGGGFVAVILARVVPESELEAALESAITEAPASIAALVGAFPATALVALAFCLALFSMASLLFSVTALRAVRILPGRATAAALAAGSILLLAVGLVVVGRVVTGIWAGVAAFVVWDVGEYADGLRTELGTDASTTRAELVHVGGSFLSGGIVAVGTTLLYGWVAGESTLVDPRLAAVAIGAGLLVVVLVSWGVRG